MTSSKDRALFFPGKQIDSFTIRKLLGQGGFGDVYLVTNSQENIYAMKTEYRNAPKRALSIEIEILKRLHDPRFPEFIACGETGEVIYLVMGLYGPSIGDIRREHKNFLEGKFVFNFALKSLEVIKAFHEVGYVHRDIKPSNFLINKDQNNPLILIDFGLSKPYIDFSTGELLPPVNGHYIGTKKYASLNAHKKRDLGRCDDLISWFYAILEMFKQRLPWRNLHEIEEVMQEKETRTEELARPYPLLFEIYTYLKQLNFADKPDYDYLSRLIQKEMTSKGYYPDKFDWISIYKREADDDDDSRPEDNSPYQPYTVPDEIEENEDKKTKKGKNDSSNGHSDDGKCCLIA